MPEPIELLTLPEVAERLRLSDRTIRRLIVAGRLRTVRIGRRRFVTSRELSAFIASLTSRVA